MTPLRVVVADVRELFEPPPFDPAGLRFERDAGLERVLKQLEARRPRDDADTLEIAIAEPVEASALKSAIATYCANEKAEQKRLLRLTRHRGLQALWIGVPVLAVCLGLSTLLSTQFGERGFTAIVSNSLIIGAWVAMWRPAELLLYDWWPYFNRIRLLDRLARLDISIVSGTAN